MTFAKQTLSKNNIFIAIGVISVLVISYFIYLHLIFVSTDNAQVEAPTVLLAPRISGFLQVVNIKEGQAVEKGAVLVQIDDRDYKAAYTAAHSDLLSLEARKRDAEKNFARIRELFSKGVVSQQQFDSSQANYNEIRARYDSSQARLAQAELNLEFTKIIAPSNGIIAKKSAEIGQLAAPGAPLVGFVSSEGRWVVANFKETEIESVKVGHKAEVTIDAISGETFHGEVESISSATGATFSLLPPDNATGNFTKVVQRIPVRIKLLNLSDGQVARLQAGLSAVVQVHVYK